MHLRGECVYVCEFVELRGKSLAPHFLPIRLHMTLDNHRERIETNSCVYNLCVLMCVGNAEHPMGLRRNSNRNCAMLMRLLENNTFLCILLH